MQAFHQYLQERIQTTGFATEDALACILPLFHQVVQTHAAGKVAPLEGLDALHVEVNQIWFEEARQCEPRFNRDGIARLQKKPEAAVEVIGQRRLVVDVDDGDIQVDNLQIGQRDKEIAQPVYLPGYVAWEHQVGHHDPITDVFSIGMILASLTCELDLADEADLTIFVENRENLFRLKPDLHPVIARIVAEMTELDRHRRPQDLSTLVQVLENYLDQDIDFDLDLARVEGFGTKDLKSKQQIVLDKLQKRLFEISRRNRLLHYRPTMQTINLTHASVPLSFDPVHIRPEQILTWNDQFKSEVVSGQPVSLSKYINFEEVLYAPSLLDRIRAEARRDQAEFGFAQLRLVICFLRWANLKESPPERYDSPFVLLPVKLTKKKGIRDTYWLEPLTSEAEINPVLRYQFRQLYDIELPETIDLTVTDLVSFYDHFRGQVESSEPAINLENVERPQIELIHEKARRRLDQYRRRAHIAGRGVRSYLDVEYSYDPANYHPLGLKLFSTRVRPPTTHLQAIIEDNSARRKFVVPPDDDAIVEKQKSFYHMREGAGDNPYHWQFDLCSVTLGNFKYRKMSLVRDYTALVDQQRDSAAFDATFSLIPRPVQNEPDEMPAIEDRYHILPCDPTQAAAVARAVNQQSYIIQGPPGTGKSQTIANLVADFVARGKRVLFVCEKRAAIDVVYARLRAQGLAPLCCLIHDSQTDKKQFVMDLKETYESFLTKPPLSDNLRDQRLAAARRELEPLAAFDAAMRSIPPEIGMPVHRLLRRAVQLRERLPAITPLQQEQLPTYAAWRENSDRLAQLADTLRDVQADGVFAHHPLHRLRSRLAEVDRPLNTVSDALREAETALDEIQSITAAAELPESSIRTLENLDELVQYARAVAPLAHHGQLNLLVPRHALAERFSQDTTTHVHLTERVRDAMQANENWLKKLSPDETKIALQQARRLEGHFTSWFRPTWWQLRKTLNACYDFDNHAVRPGWQHVLESLDREHQATSELSVHETVMHERYRFDDAVAPFAQRLSALREMTSRLPAGLREVHQQLIQSANAEAIVESILPASTRLQRLRGALDSILEKYDDLDIQQLQGELQSIDSGLDALNDFLVCLGQLARLPAAVASAVRTLPFDTKSLEAATVDRSLEAFFRQNRNAKRFSASARDRYAARLEQAYDGWLAGNAEVLIQRVQERFLERVRVSSLPNSQLNDEQKEFKKQYSRGRRELEHEFGKSMRYKSIRDLVAGDSGLVTSDLKPVWLMSPLSVSDTLPLDTDHVDVVIFDEASQITLEEAVPSLFRAAQAIVVGDEMQLPPTNFFSTRRVEDDEDLLLEDEGESVQYSLSSNSFLNHAGRNLPSTMLGWHYRSRSESLISFSNWAFYQGRLLTVPEERLIPVGQTEIRVGSNEDAAVGAAALLARPVSFHFVEHGVYDRRRNRPEADYIAHMVRDLLIKDTDVTIGIVAFSEAQQTEIEEALERLAQDDGPFRDRLEAEFEREEDGQFVGLLVKNLENIQGDERDVVIMSVCYGHGPNGKMLMNFGPINQSGGEKRLNVAFSRAKHHMALVSSTEAHNITNDYNDGANCLKNYLRYSAALSAGKSAVAEQVLRDISLAPSADSIRPDGDNVADAVANDIAKALTAKGWCVDHAVGQSHFRCDLAVRREGDSQYRLGLLLDDEQHYEQVDLLEREMMRPRLLRAFGWQIACVLSKDWYENRDEVLEALDLMASSAEATPSEEAADTESDARADASGQSDESPDETPDDAEL